MFPGVTVAAVAAPFAAASAVYALVLALSCISPSARRERGTVSSRVVLGVGHVVLVAVFLVLVAQRVNRGIDPALFTNPFVRSVSPCSAQPTHGPFYPCDPIVNPNVWILQTMWMALIVALFWYTFTITVIITQQRQAGRPRDPRAPFSSE